MNKPGINVRNRSVFAHPSDEQILRIKAVIDQTGLSRGGIYARMKQGEFPQSINLGGRAVGWLQSDINSWIEERIAASREVIS